MITQEDCVHYWKIESPDGNGGWSTGICIKCKAEKRFNNVSAENSGWAAQKAKIKG
jgi:hypothetical protein